MELEIPINVYLEFFSRPQTGGGNTGSGQDHIVTYKGARFQRGYGLGSIFTNIIKTFSPLFTKHNISQALTRVGKRAISAGVDIGSDLLDGENLADTIKKRIKDAASDLYDDAEGAVKSAWLK